MSSQAWCQAHDADISGILHFVRFVIYVQQYLHVGNGENANFISIQDLNTRFTLLSDDQHIIIEYNSLDYLMSLMHFNADLNLGLT